MIEKRVSAEKKARELAKYLRAERPDYAYLKRLFQHLRDELEIEVPKASKKLPYVPTEEELKRYYEVVWKAKKARFVNSAHPNDQDQTGYDTVSNDEAYELVWVELCPCTEFVRSS